MPAAALITGLAGLASGIASNAFGQSNATKSFERQKELMRLQNQYAVENWSRENTYNTPQAQMQRLKAAGLNPNLVYGSGSVGLDTTSGAISGPAAPAAPMAQTTPLGNSAMDAVNAAVGVAQAKKSGSETIAQDIRNKWIESEITAALREIDSRIDLNSANGQAAMQTIAESQERINRMRTQNDNETYDRFLSTLSTIGQLDRWQHENDLSDEQKKWIGTNAMAAMIGARGAAAQARAMAEAIRLFRHPDELMQVVRGYIDEIKKIKDSFNGKDKGNPTILDNLIDNLELIGEGRYWEAFVTGRKDRPSRSSGGVR